MRLKTLLFTAVFFLYAVYSQAQVEGAYINTKNFKAFGYGAHLNFKFPISEAGYLTTEAGFYYFKNDDHKAALVPFLLGYQYSLDGSGTGVFVEPLAGYTIGGTDIVQYDETGDPIPDRNGNLGEYQEQQVKGITAGLATGYIFNGRTPLTIGLRYERVFVSKDPAVNLLALRITWPLFGGRREN